MSNKLLLVAVFVTLVLFIGFSVKDMIGGFFPDGGGVESSFELAVEPDSEPSDIIQDVDKEGGQYVEKTDSFLPPLTQADIDEVNAQSRDAIRISQAQSLQAAINMFLAMAPSSEIKPCETKKEYLSYVGSTATDGTGWLPLNMDSVPIDSIRGSMPIDPINDQNNFIGVSCSGYSYRIFTPLESARLKPKMISDSGISDYYFEISLGQIGY